VPGLHVHMAIGALVGAALLPRFDRRALAVVLAAAALPDLDTLLGFWIVGGHRTILHTAVLPAALSVALAVDDRVAGARLRRRVGAHGVDLAWAGVAALAVGGIAPDLVTNGVNALWPFVDTFYTFDGRLLVTDQRGVVQSFVELQSGAEGGSDPRTTENTQFQTGVDPSPGPEEEAETDPERIFWLFTAGWQVAFTAAAAVVVPARLRAEG